MPKSFNTGSDDQDPNQSGEPQGNSFDNRPPSQDNGQPNGEERVNKTQNIDLEKINKRLNDKDEFINTLKNETQQYRQEIEQLKEALSKRPSLDEIMEHINQQAGAEATRNLDPDDLINNAVNAMEERLTAKEIKVKQEANIKAVASRLQAEFGAEDLDAKVAEIAAENDMTFDEVFDLAAKNPKAAFKLLGIKVNTGVRNNGNEGSLNTLALGNNNTNNAEPKGHILNCRSDKERVEFFNKKMAAGLKKLNQS